MKKFIYISGIVIINIFVVGALFKIQHWPGAGILITLGLGLFSFGFMPLAFIQSYKGNGGKYKSLYIAGFICAFICFLGALFKIQHWQGAGWFLLIGVPLPFLYFLPLYINYHNKSKEKSSVNFLGVMFLMVYVAVFSALLAVNISREILNAFTYGEKDYAKTNDLLAIKNQQLFNKLEKAGITGNTEKITQLKTKSEAIYTKLNSIKVELVKSAEGDASLAIESGNKINSSAIVAKYESVRTMKIMKGDDGASGKASELKGLINDYREYLTSFVGNKNTHVKIITELLNTSDYSDTINGDVYKTNWENLFFPNGAYIVTVLGNLECIETNVKMAEAEVLSQIPY
ncbi:MAG TPA: hypothetical protein PKZ21_03475 [Bacteroidales bacterium]|nr:hypothetical protein [Bacteroidales bacterium]